MPHTPSAVHMTLGRGLCYLGSPTCHRQHGRSGLTASGTMRKPAFRLNVTVNTWVAECQAGIAKAAAILTAFGHCLVVFSVQWPCFKLEFTNCDKIHMEYS